MVGGAPLKLRWLLLHLYSSLSFKLLEGKHKKRYIRSYNKVRHTAHTQALGAIIFRSKVNYENKFRTNLFSDFIKSLTELTYSTIILLLTILFYIGFSLFGTMTEKGAAKILGIIGFLALLTIISAIWKSLVALPNEKSVTIGSNSIVINFPYFKKEIRIDFNDLNYIIAKKGHEQSESMISIKTKKENILGMKEDILTINSISSSDWRKIAIDKKLPLIIHHDVEENLIRKKGIFGTTYSDGDDYYIIRKDFDDKSDNIELLDLQNYVKQNKWIKELGPEELINIVEEIQKAPKHQFSIDTMHGTKGLDYFDGQLVATYAKDQIPVEIKKISDELKLNFKNLTELK